MKITDFFTTLIVLCMVQQDIIAQEFVASEPVIVASGYGNYHPQMEVLGDGELGVIWTNGSTNALFFAKRTGIDQFATPVQLNPAGLEVQDYNWSGADLAVWGNNVYVVFRSLGYETGHIYLVKSTDNGVTFGDTVRVDNMADAYGQYPDIAVYEDTVYVTHMIHGFSVMNPQMVVQRSVDGGATFEPEVDVTGWIGPEVCDCCQPEIMVDEQRVIVFYRENDLNTRDIKAVVSHDRGVSFTQYLNIDDHNWSISACPSTGPDPRFENSNTSLTAYRTTISGVAKLFVESFDLTTATSAGTVDIFADGASNSGINYPQLAYADGLLAICWEGLGEGTDVFFNASQTGPTGLLPANAINVTNVTGSQSKPDIAILNSTFHIVYAEVTGAEVRYRRISSVNAVNENSAAVRVFPNPAGEVLTVDLLFSGEAPLPVRLFSMDGTLVAEHSLSADQRSINVSDLVPGIYLLQIVSGDDVFVQRFVKR